MGCPNGDCDNLRHVEANAISADREIHFGETFSIMTSCNDREHLYTPLSCGPSLQTGEQGECFSPSECQVQPVPEYVCPGEPSPTDPCLCEVRALTGALFCQVEDAEVGEWLRHAECYFTASRGECNCKAKALIAAHLYTIVQGANFDSHMLMSGANLGRIRYLPENHWNRSIWGQLYQAMIPRSSRPALSSGHSHGVGHW